MPGSKPRQPRIEFPGAIYHVLARGNRRAEIFSDDRDRARFLKSLGDTCVRLGWEVRAWVLMGNHYHLDMGTFGGARQRGSCGTAAACRRRGSRSGSDCEARRTSVSSGVGSTTPQTLSCPRT